LQGALTGTWDLWEVKSTLGVPFYNLCLLYQREQTIVRQSAQNESVQALGYLGRADFCVRHKLARSRTKDPATTSYIPRAGTASAAAATAAVQVAVPWSNARRCHRGHWPIAPSALTELLDCITGLDLFKSIQLRVTSFNSSI
jgi:hypothetical protein